MKIKKNEVRTYDGHIIVDSSQVTNHKYGKIFLSTCTELVVLGKKIFTDTCDKIS